MRDCRTSDVRSRRLDPAAALTILLLLLMPNPSRAQTSERLETASVMEVPPLPQPEYLESTDDPTFRTPFTRVSAPGRPLSAEISCEAAYCRHRYSSAQAWNADQSLLVLGKGCGGLCFLDGQSYQPVFLRRAAGECEWHPTEPALMICVEDQRIVTWDVRRDVKVTVYEPNDYSQLDFGPSKGNLSKDGERLVVRATSRSGLSVAFAYDLRTRVKFPDIILSELVGSNSFCSISPSGQYVLCLQTLPDGANPGYVFTTDGVQVQFWPENHRPGHGDMTLDADGRDVYVGVSKSDPDKYHVIKRRLDDGTVTSLASFGKAQHVSARNIRQPGWVFVTYGGTQRDVMGHRSSTPFYQEVVALRIDGSGEVRRIVQTRSVKHDYMSEAHASPSPDGTQVIWSSNWGQAGGPVAAYVARLSQQPLGERRPSSLTAGTP